jgi:hypothetical protein
MRDLANNLNVVASILPVAHASTVTGSAVDMQGFASGMFLIPTGAINSSGAFTVTFEESDASGSGYAAIPASHLIGTALPTSLAADTVYEQGFRSFKRYVRAVGTKTGGTSVVFAALVVRGMPHNAPVA